MNEETQNVEAVKDDKKVAAEPEQVIEDPKDEKKYTDAELDAIIGRKFAQWKEKQEKEADEAKRLAKMNAEEKAKHEQDKLKAEIAELKREKTLSEMTTTARNMLKEADITVDDVLLKALVTEDADATKSNVEAFATSYKQAVEDGITARLKAPVMKKGATTSTLTKESIMAIKDTAERQRLIAENQSLFIN
ncbi:TPA: DUF4355 domain-containing protein [Streptococcus suis]